MGGIAVVAALGLGLVGTVLLAIGVRGPWLAAISGGILVGAAAAVFLPAAGLLPLGAQTALVALLLGTALGVVATAGAWWRNGASRGRASRGRAGRGRAGG